MLVTICCSCGSQADEVFPGRAAVTKVGDTAAPIFDEFPDDAAISGMGTGSVLQPVGGTDACLGYVDTQTKHEMVITFPPGTQVRKTAGRLTVHSPGEHQVAVGESFEAEYFSPTTSLKKLIDPTDLRALPASCRELPGAVFARFTTSLTSS